MTKRPLVITGIVVAALLASLVALHAIRSSQPAAHTGSSTNQQSDSGGSTPPSKTPGSGSSGGSTTPGQTKAVPVLITTWHYDTSAQQLLVSGYAGSVVEDGGTCKVTLTKGSASVSSSRLGVGNVSNTSCGSISFARAKLTAGSWRAVLRYNSKTSDGVSSPVSVEIP